MQDAIDSAIVQESLLILRMDTLDGMPVTSVTSERVVSKGPERVEPLTELQKEFSAINNALTSNPTKTGIELAQIRLALLEENLEVALSMYPSKGFNGGSIPTLDIEGKYIDPIIANLFRARCREVITQKVDHEEYSEIRLTLKALQGQVADTAIEILDALGIVEDMDLYRERLNKALADRDSLNREAILELINDCRRFLERVKLCNILPNEFKIGATLMDVQLAQLEDTYGIIS